MRHGDAARVEQLRRLLAARLGLAFDDKKRDVLATVLRDRSAHHDLSEQEYLDQLTAQASPREFAVLAEALTITETYFFRNIEQFHALAEVVLPERLRARADQRRLRLLSVACSSGEEVYTLAAVVAEQLPDPGWDVSIVGVDVNRAMLRKAAAGRYSPWSLRETPAPIRQRWFREHSDGVEVDERLRARVRFVEHNLVHEDSALWANDTYDVVFCRNVLMYLTPDTVRSLVGRITRALAPGGYLFLGHTDTLGSQPPGLDVHHTHNTFYYQRLPALRRAVAQAPVRSPGPTATRNGPAHWPASREPDSPREATDRPPVAPAAPPRIPEREHALRLLREERFDAALAVVEALPAPQSDRPDIRLLRAALLAHAGHTGRAAELCRHVLELDGLDADAHHLLAVCHEGDDDPVTAVRHHAMAAYLDPGFAMPRLRLGLLARQRGDREAAGRELERAIGLLRDETDERILLFGGGFGRRALIALCRTELQAAGVAT